MARPARSELDEETFPVPGSVRFPVELTPPDGFDPARLETWPRVAGRLEWVRGRLLYMPPCGDRQQYTVADEIGRASCRERVQSAVAAGSAKASKRRGEHSR